MRRTRPSKSVDVAAGPGRVPGQRAHRVAVARADARPAAGSATASTASSHAEQLVALGQQVAAEGVVGPQTMSWGRLSTSAADGRASGTGGAPRPTEPTSRAGRSSSGSLRAHQPATWRSGAARAE